MSGGSATGAQQYLGREVGRWRIERLIGKGGFAWVYFATSRGEEAALKVLHDRRPTSALRFDREVRVLQKLPPNPYVTRYVDHGKTGDGRPFLAQEYVEGSTLAAWMKQAGRMDPTVAVDLVVQVCRAFTGLHELGVAHRDVKPANILLPDRGGIKLVDFGLIRDAQGLLKLFEEDDSLQSRVFEVDIDQWLLIGTPEYMAPEQFSDALSDGGGREQTDTWSDVFSLGVILYQLLEGRLPFPLPRPAKEMDQQTYVHYARWRAYLADSETPSASHVDPALRAIVRKALRRDPRRRPRDARALENLLTGFMRRDELENEEEPLTVPTKRASRSATRDITAPLSVVGRSERGGHWDDDSPTRELTPLAPDLAQDETTKVEREASITPSLSAREDQTLPMVLPPRGVRLVAEELPTRIETSSSPSPTAEIPTDDGPWEPETLVDRSLRRRGSTVPTMPAIPLPDEEDQTTEE